MKKLLMCCLLLVVSCMLFVAGCSSFQPSSISEYYNLYATSRTDNATISYSVASADNTIATGFTVTNTLPTISVSLETMSKENYKSVILPSVLFTTMKVSYAVIGDTNGVIGAWTPATITAGISIMIPGATGGGASSEGSTTSAISATLNNIASAALANQVFSKIGSVTATLNGSAAYVFKLVLSSDITIRADVTLTGKDSRDKDITLPFSTTISFAKKST